MGGTQTGHPLVDEETRRQYRDDGATVVRGAIDEGWLERLAGAIERDMADPGPFDHSYDVGDSRFHGNLRIWQHDAEFAAFCLESEAPAIARAFHGGGRLNLLYDQLFVKEPGANHPTRWHNDQPYWPVAGIDALIAIAPAVLPPSPVPAWPIPRHPAPTEWSPALPRLDNGWRRRSESG